MADATLTERLQLRPNQSILLLNAPMGYAEMLHPLPTGCSVSAVAAGAFSVVQLFAVNSAALNDLFPQATELLQSGGILWIAYPKKSSSMETDLTRDVGWSVVAAAGWQPVRQIAIDAVWSALRFKPTAPKDESDPVATQYAEAKAALRPIYDKLTGLAHGFGVDVTLEVRQNYVALRRANHFAAIQPSTRSRVDLALKLKDEPLTERLQANNGVGGGALTHKVALFSVDEVDEEVVRWLRLAYARAA